MRITLETVRGVLKDALGYQSFTASFIRKVVEDKKCRTAYINRDGQLGYSREFVDKFVSCKEDLFSLIFHELLHPMFQHFIYDNGELENIAADAIINACISVIYWQASKKGNLFAKLYRDQGIEGLLRPGCRMYSSKFENLYNNLYHNYAHEEKLSTGEVIRTLKILVDKVHVGNIVLIGSHGMGQDGKISPFVPLPKDVVQKIAGEISANLPKSKDAGHSKVLLELLKESLNTKMSIRKTLLANYATRQKIDNFCELIKKPHSRVSPIPVYPTKRDLVLLSCDIWPGYFRNKAVKEETERKGIAIYLDVSGSVNEYLPEIIGILNHLRDDIRKIYQFSNVVAETEFKTLMEGNIRTTYGTDLDCVAESVIENKYDKLIVITDGCASMNKEHQEALIKRKTKILTILYGGGDSCDDLKHFGPLVQLSEATA